MSSSEDFFFCFALTLKRRHRDSDEMVGVCFLFALLCLVVCECLRAMVTLFGHLECLDYQPKPDTSTSSTRTYSISTNVSFLSSNPAASV